MTQEVQVPIPTVFIVDNDQSLRDSLAWLVESAGFQVETFASAEAFLAACDAQHAGCLILDIRLPGISGLTLQEELLQRAVKLPVIVITGYADVDTAVRVLKTGAFDFIEKPFGDQVILERITQAIEIDRQRQWMCAERDRSDALLSRLTARERAVFDEVVHGKANKVVAYELGISQKTVESHRARVMEKLGVDSLAELVRLEWVALYGQPAYAH